VPATRLDEDTVAQQGPHLTPGPRPTGLDPLQPGAGDLVQAPWSGRRRDRAEHAGLLAQHINVTDRLASIGEHHRDISQHPAPVMDRDEPAPGHRLRQSTVKPVRSASKRSAMLLACATTPTPSPDTATPDDHEVAFTYGMPSTLGFLRLRKPKFPLVDRHFPASTRRSDPSAMNDRG
jgi:hypothetical protein